ncbi:cyclin-D-binding Myb-like transcription factor 1 isoform X2 [Asterias amurensis]|uniref:cyclin-D-binding Myb-like transcription factor 1 isoform X2 n=1 Tax=Asterias amurensis TaxID=7602 RepID=UPI003AB86444
MDQDNSSETESEISPACLVLPVNPLPSSSGKTSKRKTGNNRKQLNDLSDFPECSDSKQGIMESNDDMESDLHELSEPQPEDKHLSPTKVHCEEPIIDPVTQSWFTSRDSKDNLSKKGHKWKQGMWSKEEVDILERNIEEYLKIRKLGDAVSVIFQMSKEERKDFYRFIAKGLQRPLFAVYRRVIRMYDSKNHVGKYTPEDIQKLKELRVKYGNEWCAIGAEMGRSAASVKDKVRLLKDRCHQGKWTINEEQMLSEAVYSMSKAAPGENITTGISWSQVAAKVPTRTEKQCRAKWLNYLNWKHSGGTEWTKEDDNILLDRLADTGAQNDSQVNWEELAKNWSSVRSPQWLRSKWWMLKRHIPGHDVMSLNTLIEHLNTQPVGTKLLKSPRGPKRMSSEVNMPVTTLTVPLGTTAEQMGVYQYEVLDTPMGLAPANTYLIHSAANQGDPGTSADSYIVTTMQGEHLQSNENVTVHLNRSLLPSTGQIIISAISKNPIISAQAFASREYGAMPAVKRRQLTALTSDAGEGFVPVGIPQADDLDDQSVPSEENTLNQSQLINTHDDQLTSDMDQSEQSEDNPLVQSEMMNSHDVQLTGDISQSDQSEEGTLGSQSQLIGTDAVLTQQDMVPEVSEEPETQLVIVNSAPSASLMQPVGSVDDAQLPEGVFSLSGGMTPVDPRLVPNSQPQPMLDQPGV